MSRSDLRGWVANHPRTLAALFTVALLIAQAQTVAADTVGTFSQANPGSP